MEKRLGKGLAQMIETTAQPNANLVQLRTEQIRPSRYQPRQEIGAESLEELKASIQHKGIIQPIIVRPVAHGTYELVAGERRWRAAQALGIQQIPSIIKALNDQETLEYSIIENVQREGLNPVEEAKAFERLVVEFHYTQEQLALAVGKDRTSISNLLRILKLPDDVQSALQHGMITMGHAKALLGIENRQQQLELFHHAKSKKLSVRELEELVGQWQPKARRRRRPVDPQLKAIEDELRGLLGTKVAIASRQRGGRIVIDYFSTEDLHRILQAVGLRNGAV